MRILLVLMLVATLGISACGASGSSVRDASQPAPTSTPPRSKGCDDVPNATDLKKLLQAAPAQNGDAGGLNHGNAKRMRQGGGLAPPSNLPSDDIVYAGVDGASLFAHPMCPNTFRDGKKIGDEAPTDAGTTTTSPAAPPPPR